MEIVCIPMKDNFHLVPFLSATPVMCSGILFCCGVCSVASLCEERPNLLAQAFQRLPPPLPTQKQCVLDFAWFETIYAGRIIKCRIHNMNLAHSVSEEKYITPTTAREEISHLRCPVSASDTYFMIAAEGFPNSGLYHSFTLSDEMILGSSRWHVGLPAADLHGPFIKSRV